MCVEERERERERGRERERERIHSFFVTQLKEEFVNDRLYPRASVNTGIWMAAIDMAREAHGTDSNYTDIM